MGAIPCVSTDRSPAPVGRCPLKVDSVSALEDPPCDMGLFEHDPSGSTPAHRSARIPRVTTTHPVDGRPRARGLGIALPGEPGPLNAITDVGGVEVGMTTLIS